ncbi:uncharacterized protein J3D65DRAFT_365798 [Phyllosticta citribraziliensis]|uniref:Uncharacterized protein n=1 Tax=Phyllosticta citribraziliensis TaxID=989973 RepID=A0ABR1LPK6_9PEZI
MEGRLRERRMKFFHRSRSKGGWGVEGFFLTATCGDGAVGEAIVAVDKRKGEVRETNWRTDMHMDGRHAVDILPRRVRVYTYWTVCANHNPRPTHVPFAVATSATIYLVCIMYVVPAKIPASLPVRCSPRGVVAWLSMALHYLTKANQPTTASTSPLASRSSPRAHERASSIVELCMPKRKKEG